MSTTDLDLIKAKLFALINRENSISLDHKHFTISLPKEYNNPLHPTVNTEITITPVAGTGYQGSVAVYYKRIDFKELFQHLYYELNPIDAIRLSDIIPELNNAFGTDILKSDYTDVDLPPYISNYPDRQRIVTIAAQTNSYFFTGNYDLILGPRSVPVIDDSIIYRHYLYLSVTDPKDSFICLDSNGQTVADFRFINNASNIEVFNIDYIVQVKDNFYLVGQFKLTYLIDTELAIESSTLVINNQGIIVSHSDDPVFRATKLIPDTASNYFYTIDDTDTTVPNCLYKYNKTGQLVEYVAAIDYIPALLAVDKNDRLYTVSPPYEDNDPFIENTTSKLVRVDRLLPNGIVDTNFNTIYFKASNANYNPLRIMDIVFTDADGFYLAIEPTYGVDIGYISPIINNVPMVANTNGATTYSWNPIVRFHANGDWDTNFKPILKTQLDKTIFIQPGPHLTSKTLHLNSLNETDRLVWFSYRTNPATGFNHVQPISFNYLGNLIIDNLTNYFHHPKWVTFNNSQSLSSGKLLAHGSMQFITNLGQFSDPVYALIAYKPDTTLDRVLYQSRVTPILNTYLLETHV
jgi:hypothetical protein